MNNLARSNVYPIQRPQSAPVKSGQTPKLMDRFREAIRVRHYSRRTEEVYGHWIKRFIFHGGKPRHPQTMGAREVTDFLTYIAVKEHVSASTQNQAFLGGELGNIDAVRGKAGAPDPGGAYEG